jgi:hypothetical protein
LDFEFHTDLLFNYAIALTGLCLLGSVICVVVIIRKHKQFTLHRTRQSNFQGLLKGYLGNDGPRRQEFESRINVAINSYPIDCVYAGVRLVENLDEEGMKQYKNLAPYLRRESAIQACFDSGSLPNQCIALEAIGLGRVEALTPLVLKSVNDPVLAPYAAEALCRLNDTLAISQVKALYAENRISMSQALTALSHVELEQLRLAINKPGLENFRSYFLASCSRA